MRSRFSASLLLFILVAVVARAQDESSPADHVIPGTSAEGSLIKRVNPVYPPLARQARIQGTVVMEVKIAKSGDVQSLQLVSGHPMLAPAAIEAVKQWKYKPFVIDGEPVEVKTTVQVNFTLAGGPPKEPDAGTSPPATPQSEPSSTVPRVRISSGIASGLLVSKINPRYPPDAREQRVQGNVVMQVDIDKDGNVETVQLISGHPLLAPAAIDAVRQWKYKPYLLNGNPMNVETQVMVAFTLALR